MPEIRKDPITNRWVIISTGRDLRPSDYIIEEKIDKDFFCPFCPGNEEKVPKPVKVYNNEKNQWDMRIVPNKYPVLRNDIEKGHKKDDIFECYSGIGDHDVVIESRDHDFNYYKSNPLEFEKIYIGLKDRLWELSEKDYTAYNMFFKNYKSQAGATLSHPHSQIISMPIVPLQIEDELDGAKRFFNSSCECIYCHMIKKEIEIGLRVISENEDFISFCPYASRLPFEIWTLPKSHLSHFHFMHPSHIKSLSSIMSDVFRRVYKLIGDAPFNMFLHASPVGGKDSRHENYYHLHFETVFKLSNIAGFELASGFNINPLAPEDCAKSLREINF